MRTTCDAARVIQAMGGEPNCSDDRVEIWHGMSTPAIACGKHGSQRSIGLLKVFRGHRARMGEHVEITVLISNEPSRTYVIPTH